MIFKNRYKLPKSLVRALTNDDYPHHPDNVISCTTLIDAPKIKILQQRHDSEIEVDASERAWLLMGSSIHHVLESASAANSLSEERWYIDTKTWECYTCNPGELEKSDWYTQDGRIYISGQFDHYEDGILQDYKVTSVWSVVIGGAPKPEHVMQLNINAYAMRKIGFEVDTLQSILVLRDFQNSKAGVDGYPEIPFHVWNVKVMNNIDIINYIADKALIFELCKDLEDDKIAPCTEQQRWFRPGKFAVMKEGRKSAVKLFDDLLQATEYKQQLQKDKPKDKYYIEERPGTNVRCDGYCVVKKWCHLGRELGNTESAPHPKAANFVPGNNSGNN